MISANNITLRLGKKALFEDVNIKFTEGNCYGIIGANGAGKSTFLRILSGTLEPTQGFVSITPGQRLSVLEQDQNKYDSEIVMDAVMQGNARLFEIMKEKVAEYNRLLSIKDALQNGDEELKQKYLEILYTNPAGFRITAGMTTNYRQLKTIYSQRRNHRLPEWREFCKWIETLPHSELITGEDGEQNL